MAFRDVDALPLAEAILAADVNCPGRVRMSGTSYVVSTVVGIVTALVVSIGGTAAVKSSQAGEAAPKNPNEVSYADE